MTQRCFRSDLLCTVRHGTNSHADPKQFRGFPKYALVYNLPEGNQNKLQPI
jgi:hypothetical protein